MGSIGWSRVAIGCVLLAVLAPAAHAGQYIELDSPEAVQQWRVQRQLEAAEEYRRDLDRAHEESASYGTIFLMIAIGTPLLLIGWGLWRSRHEWRSPRKAPAPPRTAGSAPRQEAPASPVHAESPEELARRVYNALRFGNFKEFEAAYPTTAEARGLLAEERLVAYWSGPRSDAQLRLTFTELRYAVLAAPVARSSVQVHGAIALQRPAGGTAEVLSDCRLVLEREGHPPVVVALGSMVRLAGGWKLFAPPARRAA